MSSISREEVLKYCMDLCAHLHKCDLAVRSHSRMHLFKDDLKLSFFSVGTNTGFSISKLPSSDIICTFDTDSLDLYDAGEDPGLVHKGTMLSITEVTGKYCCIIDLAGRAGLHIGNHLIPFDYSTESDNLESILFQESTLREVPNVSADEFRSIYEFCTSKGLLYTAFSFEEEHASVLMDSMDCFEVFKNEITNLSESD